MLNLNQYSLEQKDFITSNGDNITELTRLINKLDKCFQKDNDNFAEICFIVYKIKQLFDNYKQVYLYTNYSYNFDTIMLGFGISKSESSRILSCYEKFCCLSCNDLELAKCRIIEEFKGFSKSKLFELLQVDNDQIIEDLKNKVIRFDFSVMQLREYVKNINTLKKQQALLKLNKNENIIEEKINEDIPDIYNPQQHYDFNYFEEKNKAQLLNIVWELQREYEKLRSSYNKLKKEKR